MAPVMRTRGHRGTSASRSAAAGGPGLYCRCRQFPSLVNCCTIDWFDEWPREALQSVAYRVMLSVKFEDDLFVPLTDVCVEIHCRCRRGAGRRVARCTSCTLSPGRTVASA